MTLMAGNILEGTVVNITSFGAFVEIEGKMGRLSDGKWVAIGVNGEALWK